MTMARILRRFTITSRSPVSRVNPIGNEITFEDAAGRPSADIDGEAAACCCGCSGLGAVAGCLWQAANIRRVKAGSTKGLAGRNLAESVDIQFLLNPGSLKTRRECSFKAG